MRHFGRSWALSGPWAPKVLRQKATGLLSRRDVLGEGGKVRRTVGRDGRGEPLLSLRCLCWCFSRFFSSFMAQTQAEKRPEIWKDNRRIEERERLCFPQGPRGHITKPSPESKQNQGHLQAPWPVLTDCFPLFNSCLCCFYCAYELIMFTSQNCVTLGFMPYLTDLNKFCL